MLTVIDCKWSIKNLKAVLGAQAKIFVRPIQINLSTTPIKKETDPNTIPKEQCRNCGEMFPVSSLRQHFQSCESSEDIPSLETVVYIVTDSGNADNSDTNQNTQAPISDPVTTDMDFSINNNIAPENAHVDLHISDVHDIDSSTSIMNEDLDPQDVMSVVSSVIHFGRGNSITDPVEILRKLQEDIVTGRPLEIADVTQSVEGDTNFILVDRDHVLTTGFDKLHPVSNADLRKTLEVQFYNEVGILSIAPTILYILLLVPYYNDTYMIIYTA